ncbi:MAG TPA: YciI family protein [Actinomycetota bacterium]|nr:YciI family protein [Actinomycetota bacterium]
MRYVLLIYGDEATFEAASEAAREAVRQEYGKVAAGYEERGAMRGGDELAPSSSATTVRIRGGEQLVTDGPFAETKEQLGGYFIVEADNLDAAIELAAQLPGARTGSIEVRPIIDM